MSRGARGGQCNEAGTHTGRSGIDDPHSTIELARGMLRGSERAGQLRGDMDGHHTVTSAVGQCVSIHRRQLGRAGTGGADVALIEISRHLVDTVAQIGAVEEDVQRHHPNPPLGDRIVR